MVFLMDVLILNTFITDRHSLLFDSKNHAFIARQAVFQGCKCAVHIVILFNICFNSLRIYRI